MNSQQFFVPLVAIISIGTDVTFAQEVGDEGTGDDGADFVVSDNASWLRMFAGVRDGQTVQIGTRAGQQITGITDATLKRAVKGVTVRSFSGDERCFSLFNDIGGGAVNHYHAYGGNTFIIGCTGNDTSRSNMLSTDEVKSGSIQSDRGPIIGFGTHATENRTRLIYQVNNSWQGRGTGIERVAFHDPDGFRQLGSHNAKFGFPHADKPKGPDELYVVFTDPQYTDTDAEDFRPRGDSPLVSAGTTKFDGVPEFDPLGEPVFDQLDVFGNTIPESTRPLIGAVAPQ